MSKVKIKQIALSFSDDYPDQYLDVEGRVWQQSAVYNTVVDKNGEQPNQKVFSHYEWIQFDLPEEPES